MQVQKEEIRERILEAALTEFSEKGYEKTTMSAIADRCKISKSNLYRYFTSKKELYLTLMKPYMNKMRSTMIYLTSDIFTGETRDYVAKTMTDALYQVVCEYKKELKVIMTTRLEDEEISFQEEMTQYLVKCFITFDTPKMPEGFSIILASMLMDGINNIFRKTEDNAEIYRQLLAMFQYHTNGISVFLPDTEQ